MHQFFNEILKFDNKCHQCRVNNNENKFTNYFCFICKVNTIYKKMYSNFFVLKFILPLKKKKKKFTFFFFLRSVLT